MGARINPSIANWTRRAAVLSLVAISAAASSGCNTPQTAGVPIQPAAAQPTAPGVHIGAIQVDTAPLIAQVGNPTASWAQQALPGQFAQAFAAHMDPGVAGAATLGVRIDSCSIWAAAGPPPDIMKGVVTLNGRQTRVRATSTYFPNPTDQALPEQALQGRVTALSQAFAYWAARRMRL